MLALYPGGESKPTWRRVLKLFLLVVIDNDVCLYRDQLLLVKLSKVQQGELIKLLITEQDLQTSQDLSGHTTEEGTPPLGRSLRLSVSQQQKRSTHD